MVRIWTPKNPDFALTLPLAVICSLLGLVLVLELFAVQRAAAKRAQNGEASVQEQSPAGAEPDAVFQLPAVEEFSAFVERPLFVEGRKPPVEGEQQAQAPKPEDLAPLELSLMGVMFSPQGKMAILAEASGKNRRVKLGGTIEGWRLIDLRADRVTLQRGDEQRDLPLMKPRPKAPPQPTAPPPGRRGQPTPPQPQPIPIPPQPPMEVNEPEEELVEPAPAGESMGLEGQE